MLVELHGQPERTMAVLKMYDRRIGNPRKWTPYSLAAERAWQAAVRSGRADTTLRKLQEDREEVTRKILANKAPNPIAFGGGSEEDPKEDEITVTDQVYNAFNTEG